MNVNDPKVKKEIIDALDEISNSMFRAASERDFQKEAIKNICEKHSLDKKLFRKMAKVHHNSNFNEEVAANEEFETMYETITGSKPE